MSKKNHIPAKAGTHRNTIFVVDHATDNLDRFKALFRKTPHMVYYSTSPEDIKAIMVGVSPDMVIGNFHMPGHAAIDFFSLIKREAPHAIRVVFAEEADAGLMMRLLACGTVHRFFCLPWKKHDVDSLLIRDLATRARLRTRKVWDFLEAESRIPVLPEVAMRMEEVLHDAEFSMEQLVNVIKQDPVVAAKLLQLVNSSAFPKDYAITSLQRAVTYLGIRQVRELVLFLCAREIFPPSRQCSDASVQVAKQSFRCSKLACLVAKTVAPGLEMEAATAALLQDIGKLVLFTPTFCETYLASLALDPLFGVLGGEVEEDEAAFGISHTELGSCLLLWWDMPFAIVETTANHNLPLAELQGIPKSVAIAQRCLQEARFGDQVVTDLASLDPTLPLALWRKGAKAILGG